MKIVFDSGREFDCPEASSPPVQMYRTDREYIRITVIGAPGAVAEAFVDGAKYAQVWESMLYGGEESETIIRDLSPYSEAGEISDLGDGTCRVDMMIPSLIFPASPGAKYTQAERDNFLDELMDGLAGSSGLSARELGVTFASAVEAQMSAAREIGGGVVTPGGKGV